MDKQLGEPSFILNFSLISTRRPRSRSRRRLCGPCHVEHVVCGVWGGYCVAGPQQSSLVSLGVSQSTAVTVAGCHCVSHAPRDLSFKLKKIK
ncbi:hypothetical protein RRG08_023433 [Elysia crispata]|uniref:Uncharacterized protein n=1 Tax=Elysia crispata TaxID=231223 RepID=A0AAE1CX93_9GAST|nr:hypothetical protein RRG08_023433 [Elysia crispata]